MPVSDAILSHMSLTYSLYLDTDLSPGQIMKTIEEHISPSAKGTGLQSIIGVDMDACIRSKLEPELQDFEGPFGFVPNRVIYMRMDKSLRHEGGIDSIIRTTAALANSLPCDMFLLFNGEYPYLVRHAGKTMLNSQGSEKVKFWDGHALELLNLPPNAGLEFKDMREIIG